MNTWRAVTGQKRGSHVSRGDAGKEEAGFWLDSIGFYTANFHLRLFSYLSFGGNQLPKSILKTQSLSLSSIILYTTGQFVSYAVAILLLVLLIGKIKVILHVFKRYSLDMEITCIVVVFVAMETNKSSKWRESKSSGCRTLWKAFVHMMDIGRAEKPNSLTGREANIFIWHIKQGRGVKVEQRFSNIFTRRSFLSKDSGQVQYINKSKLVKHII